MAEAVVAKLAEVGRLVDPVMERYLLNRASEAFAGPLLYPIRTGGKRIRPALTLTCARAVGGDYDCALPAAAAVEMAHNYSLIVDDIIDHSEFRRGKPTVWKKYGLSTALLVAFHYREAIAEALNDTPDPPRFHDIMAWTLKMLVEGERLDILFEQAGREDESYVVENRYARVTLDDYVDMVSKKTAALIQTSCVFGALSARAPEEVVEAIKRYGWNVGIAFQIMDDLLDVFGREEKIGKKVGKDIIEHKLGNVVVALAAEELSGSDREELLRILRKPKVGDEDVKRAIELISRTRARERAGEMMRRYVDEALKALEPIPEGDAKRDLRDLAIFIITREY